MPNSKNPTVIFQKKGLIILFLFLLGVGFFLQSRNQKSYSEVCFEDHCFKVEVVEEPKERQKGLMFRGQLAPDQGMLFIFEEEGIHPFWMKNTFFPLDIIWVQGTGQVADIEKNTAPCGEDVCESIVPQGESKYVLEINAGTSDKIGLKIGDRMVIQKR